MAFFFFKQIKLTKIGLPHIIQKRAFYVRYIHIEFEIFLQISYFQIENILGIFPGNKLTEKKNEHRILYCTK